MSEELLAAMQRQTTAMAELCLRAEERHQQLTEVITSERYHMKTRNMTRNKFLADRIKGKTEEGKGKAHAFNGVCSYCKKFGHKKECRARGDGGHKQRRVRSANANQIEGDQTAQCSAEANSGDQDPHH